MAKLTMVQALNQALQQEMEANPDIVVLGEDVAQEGGVFRITEGLLQKFGPERVVDTPLSENGIIGTAIGMAVYGLHPVAEVQFSGFMYYAFHQLISHAARLRNRSRGRFHVPLVVRSPYGGGVRALEHHSGSMESVYLHSPGLKFVIPSSPYEAKGLLISAMRDPDPVIFYEPKKLYRAFKEEVPEEPYAIPLGQARLVQIGKDVTVIAYGSMLQTAQEAIEELGKEVSCELIDLRCLAPCDWKTVIKSAEKTGRVVIVSEAIKTLNFASEIAMRISESEAFLELKAPIKRVTGYDIHVPLPKREDKYFPDPFRVKLAIEEVMQY